MRTTHRFRPLFAALALAALLLVPGSAAADPRDPVTALAAWLGGLWETLGLPTVGLILDPSGGTTNTGGGTDTADEGLILDPSGSTTSTGGDTATADEGLILDPDGRP